MKVYEKLEALGKEHGGDIEFAIFKGYTYLSVDAI
jgi:hypothetical protein